MQRQHQVVGMMVGAATIFAAIVGEDGLKMRTCDVARLGSGQLREHARPPKPNEHQLNLRCPSTAKPEWRSAARPTAITLINISFMKHLPSRHVTRQDRAIDHSGDREMYVVRGFRTEGLIF